MIGDKKLFFLVPEGKEKKKIYLQNVLFFTFQNRLVRAGLSRDALLKTTTSVESA